MTPDRVYTVNEAAEHLRVSRRHVEKLIARGLLGSFRPDGARRLVTGRQLAAYIERVSGGS